MYALQRGQDIRHSPEWYDCCACHRKGFNLTACELHKPYYDRAIEEVYNREACPNIEIVDENDTLDHLSSGEAEQNITQSPFAFIYF